MTIKEKQANITLENRIDEVYGGDVYMWIDTDIAIPSFDSQIVKVKVADYIENYETEGYYNHRERVWYNINGICLNENVYEWYMKL